MTEQEERAHYLPAALTARIDFVMQMALGRIQAAGEIALRELGITGREYGVLAVLDDDRRPTQHQVGVALGIDRTTTMTLVTGLEGKGLIERTRDGEDRRAYLVGPTEEGARVRDCAAAVLIECEDRFLAMLDDNDRNHLLSLLHRLA